MSRIKDYNSLPSLEDLIDMDEYRSRTFGHAYVSKCCQAPVDLKDNFDIPLEQRRKHRPGLKKGDYIYTCTKCGKKSDSPSGNSVADKTPDESYRKKRESEGY